MEHRYAGFDRRLLAAIFDVTLASMIMVPIIEVLNDIILGDKQIEYFLNEASATDKVSFSWFINRLLEEGFLFNYILIQAISLFLFASYMIVFWVKFGATPGKWIVGYEVLDRATNKKLTLPRAILRFLCYIPSTLALCIGFFAIKWNKESMGWHDRMANTICVRSDSSLNLLKLIFNKFYSKARKPSKHDTLLKK